MTMRNLMNRDPFNALARDFRRVIPTDLSRWFEDDERGMLSDWEPAVDVKETDKEYIVTADIPGVKPENIDIRLEGGMLTLSGDRKAEKRDEHDGYRRVERYEGRFYRAISLPDAANADNVEAKAKDGVLTVHLPKITERQAKRIKVST